uniref:Uncharacterized protein n=1 Tax=Lepeophtheirus salmonis TaxID=72036 RepID=A0A0K2T682_LEPSM
MNKVFMGLKNTSLIAFTIYGSHTNAQQREAFKRNKYIFLNCVLSCTVLF